MNQSVTVVRPLDHTGMRYRRKMAPNRAFDFLYASIHLPRIGYSTKGFNWYGTERLIRKYLGSRGIPTFVYYFPRIKASSSSKESTTPILQS